MSDSLTAAEARILSKQNNLDAILNKIKIATVSQSSSVRLDYAINQTTLDSLKALGYGVGIRDNTTNISW